MMKVNSRGGEWDVSSFKMTSQAIRMPNRIRQCRTLLLVIIPPETFAAGSSSSTSIMNMENGLPVQHGVNVLPDVPALAPPIRPELAEVTCASYFGTELLHLGDRAIFLRDGREMRRVFLRDIVYVEAEGNYVELHLRRGRVVLHNSLIEALKMLSPDVFVIVNRAQAVNMFMVDHIMTDEIRIGKLSFTLSRRYRDELLSRLPVVTGR
jgi:hypothetical protein